MSYSVAYIRKMNRRNSRNVAEVQNHPPPTELVHPQSNNCFCLTWVIILSATVCWLITSHMKIEGLLEDIKYVSYYNTKKYEEIVQQHDHRERQINYEIKKLEKISKYMQKIQHDLKYTNQKVESLNDVVNSISNDKARINYALESFGTRVENIGKTQIVNIDFSWFHFFKSPKYGPRQAIQMNRNPGECYAFYGHTGEITIKLFNWIRISEVSIYHIPSNIVPNLSSAPREFKVYGMQRENDEAPTLFGHFIYDIVLKKELQYFQINQSCLYVKFEFLSNHGNSNYTCVYGIGVHGTIDEDIDKVVPN